MAKDDPRNKLSDFETEGAEFPEQKTSLLSKEQLQFYIAYTEATKELGETDFGFYRRIAEYHARVMMSYKGFRSEQVKDMFISQREDKAIVGGHQPVSDHLRGRHDARRTGPSQ